MKPKTLQCKKVAEKVKETFRLSATSDLILAKNISKAIREKGEFVNKGQYINELLSVELGLKLDTIKKSRLNRTSVDLHLKVSEALRKKANESGKTISELIDELIKKSS